MKPVLTADITMNDVDDFWRERNRVQDLNMVEVEELYEELDRMKTAKKKTVIMEPTDQEVQWITGIDWATTAAPDSDNKPLDINYLRELINSMEYSRPSIVMGGRRGGKREHERVFQAMYSGRLFHFASICEPHRNNPTAQL